MTIERVFVEQHLPRGIMMHRDRRVDPKAIRRVALLTVEGEKDDITGGGQTLAAHGLATSIPEDMRYHHLQSAVGHYGVFNGSRFRADIAPRVMDFMRTHAYRKAKAAQPTPTAKPSLLKMIRGGKSQVAAVQAPKKD